MNQTRAARKVGLFALCALASLPGCRESFLQGSAGALEFQPAALDFGPVYAGASAEQTVELLNSGRSTLPIEWNQPSAPFELDELPPAAPAGASPLTIRFRPTGAGDFHAELLGHYAGESVALKIHGAAADPPPCPTPVACHQMRFELEEGRCVETALADGVACDPHSVCVSDASCQGGLCIGTLRSCDDGDACNLDVCDPRHGCEHLPAAPCPGDGKCQVGVCDPASGCGLAPASDGTVCGPVRTCDVADVCIAGSCVQRDPPDGFVCAPASPCQAEGRCAGSVCDRPPPAVLTQTWSFDAQGPPDGGSVNLHDVVVEADGAVSMMGFFSVPVVRANTAAAQSLPSAARRCILWNARLVCADYPYTAGGKVSAIDPVSGETRWTFDLPAARPDWVQLAAPGRLFMARLAALGSDRLAALFEGYPSGQDGNTMCRLFFFVVLDAAGTMVSATQLTDPLLSICNHPHPYGMAADVAGDVYIAFSPSGPGTAPLLPQAPTLMVSYTRDGVFRWKRQDSFVGGELAVALGSIYPENGGTAYSALTGGVKRVLNPLPSSTFGRVVATADRLIPSPDRGSNQLYGYPLSSGPAAWVHHSPAPLVPHLIRLASWRPKAGEPAESVALVFTDRAGETWLTALRTRFGNEAWSCPVGGPFRTEPQLFEITRGAMVLMEGSDQCGTCDPGFASSQAAFHTYLLPGVELPFAPWTGTWGGPGHDHREDPLSGPGPSQ